MNRILLLLFLSAACSPEESIRREQRIAFISNEEQGFDIYTAKPDGRDRIRLTSNEEWDWYPKYSETRNSIVFNSNVNEEFALYEMKTDGSQRTRLGHQIGDTYQFSPNASQIVYNRKIEENNEIFISNTDGSNEINISKSNAYDGRPKWSRTGDQIAFISDRDGDNDLFLYDLNTEEVTQLTYNSAREKYFDWSSDGQSIFFTSDMDNEIIEIYKVRLSDGQVDRVTDNSFAEIEIAVSSYDDIIAFHNETDGNNDIYTLNPATGELVQITDDKAYQGEPEWILIK